MQTETIPEIVSSPNAHFPVVIVIIEDSVLTLENALPQSKFCKDIENRNDDLTEFMGHPALYFLLLHPVRILPFRRNPSLFAIFHRSAVA
jgi:hypothetical protein